MDYAAIKALGVEPISSEHPGGTDTRSDALFEQLKAEIQKTESLAAETADWQTVVETGKKILATESKDLLVASYFCLALFQTDGYPGLWAGLTCVGGMCASFWEVLFPPRKRKKGRMAAVSWLAEKTARLAEHIPLKPDEREVGNHCIAEIDALNAMLSEKFPDNPLGLYDLKNIIERHLDNLPVEKSPPPSEPEPPKVSDDQKEKAPDHPVGNEADLPPSPVPPPPSPNLAPLPSSPTETSMENEKDALKIIRDTGIAMRQAAVFLRDRNIVGPMPYKINRFLCWLDIVRTPPHENFRTRIPAPDPELKNRIAMLRSEANHAVLIPLVESQLMEYPFWLDLNFFAQQALKALDATQAAQMVTDETVNFINHLPEMPELQFSDGTFMAGEETRMWLDTLRPQSPTAAASEAVTDDRHESVDRVTDIKKAVDKLINGKKIREAFLLFQTELAGVSDLRERYVLKTELARFCLHIGEIDSAMAILHELDEIIQEFALERWEPRLAANVLALQWQALDKLVRHLLNDASADSDTLRQNMGRVYDRICRLDPLKAFELTNAKRR